MRACAPLLCLTAACASAPVPAGKTVQDDELDRIPDVPASELAERILADQFPKRLDITGTFMVVEVNLLSADNARVGAALVVLEAIATSLDRRWSEYEGERREMYFELSGIGPLVDHVREILDQRLKTAPCSLVFAVEHAAGRFDHLPGYVPPIANYSPTRKHDLSFRTFSCVIKAMKEKVAACHTKHDAVVDIAVSKQGIVASAVTKGELANTPAGDCVAAAVRTVTFPPSDEVITLTYPRY
jgi:hypothetical protein